MHKFILKKTGEEVKIGDTLKKYREEKTSFGTIKTLELIQVTSDNISTLMESGIIDCIRDKNSDKLKSPNKKDKKYFENNIGYYIEGLASRLSRSVEETTKWLNDLNQVCPKAVLDILLQEISLRLYADDIEAFNATDTYYSLRPRDGKVGRVQNIGNYIPLFKSTEDAEKARAILKDQLNRMYGKQEGN